MSLLATPSIRRQLMFWLVLPISVALILSALIVHKLAADFVTKAYDRALYDSALDLSRRFRLRDARLVVDLPPAAADMLEVDDLDRVYYQVRSGTGELIAGRADLPHPRIESDRRPVYYYARYQQQQLRMVSVRFPYDPDDELALALVIVGETVIRREQLAYEVLVAVAISHVVLFTMVGLAVYLGVWHGLLPLGRLRKQLELRSYRDLTPLDEPQTPAEIRPMVHATNALMQRLEHAIASEQRFIADAAHQLRTPLAGLKMHAELALRESSIDGMRERVHTLVLATDRSARLAHQLLVLARAEPDTSAATTMQPVDIHSLARAVTSEWVPRAIERGIDLGLSASGSPALVRGNEVLLRELLTNLVDNAVRYVGTGGRVTVRVQSSGGIVTVLVEDDGPGIPVADRERVFQRFQRLDTTAADGCGLGLAIVREIADAHRARVTLESGPNREGTTVRVQFESMHVTPDQPQ